MDISSDSLSSKQWWKMRFFKHGDDVLLDGSVRSFGYSVLLRTRTDSVLASNSMIEEKLLEFIRDILPSFVISQAFDFCVEVILCIGLVSFKRSEGFVFRF